MDVDDPAVGLVTITDAEVSADMRNSRVYYSVLGSDEQVETTGRAIRRAAKFINVRLADRLEMKYTPSLYFTLDQTAQHAQRIEQLLRATQQEATSFPDADELDDDDQS